MLETVTSVVRRIHLFDPSVHPEGSGAEISLRFEGFCSWDVFTAVGVV